MTWYHAMGRRRDAFDQKLSAVVGMSALVMPAVVAPHRRDVTTREQAAAPAGG